MKKALKNKKGFTLVEIIVVLVILAILAAVSIPAMIGFVNDARGKAFASEARVGLSAAQAVVTEVLASNPGNSISDAGVITMADTSDINHNRNVLATPTFAGMVQDVTGAVYVTTNDAAGNNGLGGLTANPFTSVTIGANNRVTGIVYDSTPGAGGGYIVTIAGGTTTVSRE